MSAENVIRLPPRATWGWAFDGAKNGDEGCVCCRVGDRITCLHIIPKGSDFRLFNEQFIVAGPSHAPYILNPDGTTEQIRP